MLIRVALFLLTASVLFGQSSPAPASDLKERGPAVAPVNSGYQVDAGTHILLTMINGVSTKQAQVGDRIYLETAFPVMVKGKIVVPQGSWVNGTVSSVQKPSHVKHSGELQVRFDTLTLANGTSRDFRSDLGALDGESAEKLDREHSKVTGESGNAKRAATVAGTSAAGAGIGAGVGAIRGAPVGGALMGAGIGAAAGLIGTMFAHRPDAMLPRGTTVEMVLDRPLTFSDDELRPAH